MLVPGEVMETGCCTRAAGVEFKRSISSGDLVELTLGPFAIQRNRVVT